MTARPRRLGASASRRQTNITLGVDPGLVCTAWCAIERRGTRRHYVASGSIKPLGGLDDLGRILFIRHALNVAVSDHHPDVVALEDYTYQGPRSHNANAMRLSTLIGNLSGVICDAECQPVLITMGKNVINQRLGLRGKVPKSRVRKGVEAMLVGAKLRNEHEVDAAAAAISARQEVAAVRKAEKQGGRR